MGYTPWNIKCDKTIHGSPHGKYDGYPSHRVYHGVPQGVFRELSRGKTTKYGIYVVRIGFPRGICVTGHPMVDSVGVLAHWIYHVVL